MKNNRAIIIGFVALLVLAVVYLMFFRKSDTADITASGASSPAELYFVNLASQLNTLTFDTSVLKDPRFAALVDIRTAVIPVPPGRTDPFAPVPGVQSSNNSNSSGAGNTGAGAAAR